MNAQTFLAEFEHIANAPGGVAKLRELMIQLAISGRIVERIDGFSSVGDALKEAAAQKGAYQAELGLRAAAMLPTLKEFPFQIPAHWEWVCLDQISLYIQRGKGPSYADNGSVRVISQKCIQWRGFDIGSARFVSDDSLDSYGKERFLRDEDLLWNSTGTGTAGRVAVYRSNDEVSAVADSHVTVIRLVNSSSRYLWFVVASPWVQSRMDPSHPDSLVSGTTQQVELNTSIVRSLPIPLPPLEEQARIVAKVDELMALCDTLEAQQQSRRKLQNSLRQFALQAVASATSPHELQTAWTRLTENFGRMFHAPEDVAELRSLVKDLAIRGLLTDQGDGSHQSEFHLYDLDHERESLRKSKGIRASRPVILPDQFEEPFPLPRGWKWLSLDQICYQITDGAHHTPSYFSSGVPFLSVKDVSRGEIDFSSTRFISPEAHAALAKRCNPELGDLLLTKIGTTGIAKIVDKNTPFSIFVSVALLKFPHKYIVPLFLELLISSPFVKRQSEDGTRGIGNKNLVLNTIKAFAIPLPPLSEQKRILKKAAELIFICDLLEAKVKSGCDLSTRLAASAISSLTGIAIKEEEPMKAPQTELIATLRLGAAPNVKAQAPLATILVRHNSEMSAKDLWQRFGGEIDAFYAQLKTEVAHGWILEPSVAEMREKTTEDVGV